MIVLPFTPSEPDQEITIQIGDSQYRIRALWNARTKRWAMNVLELDGTPITIGVTINLGAFLGRTSTHPLFRAGAFVAIDTTTSEAEAGLDDLGGRVEVRYYPLAELLALLASTGFVS